MAITCLNCLGIFIHHQFAIENHNMKSIHYNTLPIVLELV